MEKKYAGKILLFGEYTIIDGGQALAFPLSKYVGFWEFVAHTQDDRLKNWAEYLEENKLGEIYDLSQFKKDISAGLRFNSTIPQGYGAGSSGGLTAAFYDRYKIEKKEIDLQDLRDQLSALESYFHGKSSGMDPIVSYLNRPIHQAETMHPTAIEEKVLQSFYLIDTGKSRETAPLVKIFNSKKNQKPVAKALKLLNLKNEAAIQAVLKPTYGVLSGLMRDISEIQFEHFKEMIPEEIQAAWLNGIKTDRYYYKLCGAGGGGFILVYANQKNKEDWIPIISSR